MAKIIHVTHSDLDAVGCDLVVRAYACMKYKDVDTHFCNVTSASKVVYSICDSITNNEISIPEIIFITDISITQECAAHLDAVASQMGFKIMLIDHHPTNNIDQFYSWATILSDAPLVSATEIIFNIFSNDFKKFFDRNNIQTFELFEKICYDISRYDTWRWKNDPTDYHEEDYNICFHFYGHDKYCKKLFNAVFSNDELFDDVSTAVVENFKNRRENEIYRFFADSNKIWFTNDGNYKIGYLMYNGEFVNNILEEAYTRYPDIDIIAGLVPATRTIQFRSNKSYIDVGKYAKEKYNGGGHKSAAGASFIRIDKYCKLLNSFYTAVEAAKRNARKK